jgi:uncharacterized protein YgbK (DUF1537 family)
MRVGIIADDLTGAMDSAAPFADGGLAARVLLAPGSAMDAGEDAAVLAIDTHSRDLAADAAARAVHGAFTRLGADRLYFKKIDSTLRGNLAAEIAAALQASQCRCAVVAPAAPAQGRVLRDGQLFVDGERVPGPSLVELLREGLPDIPVRPLRRGDAVGDTHCVLVADAQTEEDLGSIARRCLASASTALLAGSSGLAAALVREMQLVSNLPRDLAYDRLVVVVGSYNARSAAQVRALLAQGEVDASVLTASGEWRRARSDSRIALLHVEGLGAAPKLDGHWVSQHLAHAAADLLASPRAASTALFLTGGDTGRAVLSRLEVGCIDVIGSLYPGVVHGRVWRENRRLGVVTKAGGFGAENLFLEAAAALLKPGR